ncbi:4-oxalomesaconate hydratase [Secundilactobacillus silagincola]|uniref:4-oxalomesaconate hydratase n=1 Tax=Secundilactobacillus silagincola TaxID=1714681 RepID=A0A1Z5J3H0_9LACO|nr:amidohydrolase family protein [Secundilactobacillus silagincola]GAX08567.1 4-oxalomesaconate hydratase [Secundilactobacillus silagincola]
MTKIITVEEHFEIDPGQSAPKAKQESKVDPKGPQANIVDQYLHSFDKRLEYMDKYNIDMQVVSNTGGPMLAGSKEQAVTNSRQINDLLGSEIKKHPTRFGGLATLPVNYPEAAAEELERAVTQLGINGAIIGGLANDHFLDEPQYFPIFETAAKLDVPIYLHPGMVRESERKMLYHSPSYSDQVGDMIALAGWVWHMEQGIQMMHLILSGIFDKLPNLKLVSGHWGEFVPYFLERLDEFTGMTETHLDRKFSEYYRNNVYVTASGMFTQPQMDLALAEMGPDHVLWAEDFPYLRRENQVADFLEQAPITQDVREKIGHENSEKLFKLN